MTLTVALSGAALAQEGAHGKKSSEHDAKTAGKVGERKPPERETESAAGANGVLKRGAAIGEAKKVSLAKALKDPKKLAGKTVAVSGIIVRSCKMEGCWMELAPGKNAKSVRVTFKDHGFFIPLDAAGMSVKAEGVFTVKNLTKAEVDHLVNEDGAKFDNINKDGTVTEISFEAAGVELSKATK